MPEILLVEDDTALAEASRRAVAGEGRHVTVCATAAAARQALEQPVDLVLLDVGLPDGDGLELCREVRLAGCAPVIFLTANDTEQDEIAGFAAGGDDYITKPFSLSVLRARVDAMLRRAGGADVVLTDGFRFDFCPCRVFQRWGSHCAVAFRAATAARPGKCAGENRAA